MPGKSKRPTASQLERLKARLLEERASLIEDVQRLETEAMPRGAAERSPSDRLEGMTFDTSEEELSLTLLAGEEDEVRRIDHALKRIEEGTYGICEDCSEPIAFERLQVLPRAACCVACQDARDRAAD